MTLGVMGEYIGRIYDQTRGRPRYLALEEQLRSPRLGNSYMVTTGPAQELLEVAH
jgi:hypothetical protein